MFNFDNWHSAREYFLAFANKNKKCTLLYNLRLTIFRKAQDSGWIKFEGKQFSNRTSSKGRPIDLHSLFPILNIVSLSLFVGMV
jgi:hypothetical protein